MKKKDGAFADAGSLKRRIRNDIILCLAVLAVSITVLFAFLLFGREGSYAEISVDGERICTLPLSEDCEYRVTCSENPEHYNTVVVKDGKVFVSEANCRDKICQNHVAISRENDTIVCLPHKLVVAVK